MSRLASVWRLCSGARRVGRAGGTALSVMLIAVLSAGSLGDALVFAAIRRACTDTRSEHAQAERRCSERTVPRVGGRTAVRRADPTPDRRRGSILLGFRAGLPSPRAPDAAQCVLARA